MKIEVKNIEQNGLNILVTVSFINETSLNAITEQILISLDDLPKLDESGFEEFLRKKGEPYKIAEDMANEFSDFKGKIIEL